MYWIYVLECFDDESPVKSQDDHGTSWYIGYTADLKRRIAEHTSGYGSKTTSKKRDWKCIYCEGYLDKKDAMGRERFLKSGSGRKFLKKQLRNYLKE